MHGMTKLPTMLPNNDNNNLLLQACAAGSECPVNTNSGSLCAAGRYSSGGAQFCSPCPAGYRCPLGSSLPLQCTAGTYSSGTAGSCTNCDAGFLCRAGSTVARPLGHECPMGGYCTSGATSVSQCSPGEYGYSIGAGTSAEGCKPCPGKRYLYFKPEQ